MNRVSLMRAPERQARRKARVPGISTGELGRRQSRSAALDGRTKLGPGALASNAVLQLQGTVGNRAVSRLLARGTGSGSRSNRLSGSGLIQRLIFYDHTVPEFQVDGKKPGFMGSVKAMVLLASQSRDHIVPYAAIENDLAILLNQWIAAAPAAKAGVWTLIANFSEALFPNKGPGNKSYHEMVKRRTNLHGALSFSSFGNFQKFARAFLSALNSSVDNIRAGDSTLNSSIGENLDTDFLPGFSTVPAGGLPVVGSGGAATVPAGTAYLRLKPASEAVLWEYQRHTTQDLSFVLNPTTNTQVSSVDAPTPTGGAGPGTVSGLPVIVFDPSGVGLPFFYS